MDEALKMLEEIDTTGIASSLVALVDKCVQASRRKKLPSAVTACLLSTFHKRRGCQTTQTMWKTFLPSAEESVLCFQLILDNILKARLERMAADLECVSTPAHAVFVKPLTFTETNAVRYMAGFVAVKLLRRYRKPTRHQAVQVKRGLFVRVLGSMKADNQPGDPDTVLEYTKLWSELIDRGGLYHI